MYSNQKDQIELEKVYESVHNEEAIPDAGLGNALLLFGFMFLATASEFVLNQYKMYVRNKDIKTLVRTIIQNLKQNKELQEKINKIKQEADSSNNKEYTKAIKSLLYEYIKNDSNFSANVENKYEDVIIKKILELMPDNFAGKSEKDLERDIYKNINMTNAQIQDQKRRRMGLGPVTTIRPNTGI